MIKKTHFLNEIKKIKEHSNEWEPKLPRQVTRITQDHVAGSESAPTSMQLLPHFLGGDHRKPLAFAQKYNSDHTFSEESQL